MENGRVFKTDDGWNYNVGKENHYAIEIKDPALYYNQLKATVKSDNFKNFIDGKSKEDRKIIGVFSKQVGEKIKKITKSETNTVFLSRETLTKHKEKHDGTLQVDYKKIPGAIYDPDSVFLEEQKPNGTRSLLFYYTDKETGKTYIYKIPLKLTEKKDEIFMTSFYFVEEQETKKLNKRNIKQIYRKK